MKCKIRLQCICHDGPFELEPAAVKRQIQDFIGNMTLQATVHTECSVCTCDRLRIILRCPKVASETYHHCVEELEFI